MPRRTHKKSRNGCIECKRRHIKCDERRPTCANCSISERVCEYFEAANPPASRSRSPPVTPAVIRSPVDNSVEQLHDQVNMLHIELFHLLSTKTLSSLDYESNGASVPFSIIFEYCLPAPYLMNQTLALAALHMSTLRPNRAQFYRSHASQLQTHALSIFNATKPEVNEENCGSIYLFSSFLGMHMICDTLVFHGSKFDEFLDSFISATRLHRGVRVVAGMSMHLLDQTTLKPMLAAGIALASPRESLDEELCDLMDAISKSSLGELITDTYRKAIQFLHSVIHATAGGGQANGYIIVGWPVLVPGEYVNQLMLRRPEALVILAYYGVLLHQNRCSWAIGDSGRFFIESINSYLGPEWEKWLAYPNAVLKGT